MGIKLNTRKVFHPGTLPPKETWARASIVSLARHGEADGDPERIYNVLALFLTDEGNQTQLYGDAISGVGLWYRKHRIKQDEMGILLQEFHNCVNIKNIRKEVKDRKISDRPPQIGLLVAMDMEDVLEKMRVG